MYDFDHHQESCHNLELLGSTTGTTIATIKNNIWYKKQNNNNPDESLIPTINKSASIPEFYQEWITSAKSESEIDNFFYSADWITNKFMDQIYTYAPQLAYIITEKINLSSIKSKEVFERNYDILFLEKENLWTIRNLTHTWLYLLSRGVLNKYNWFFIFVCINKG